jgi:hypothetical protein
MTSARENLDLFLKEAESYVGYTSTASAVDMFSQAAGYPGQTWNGAFIDVVAKKAGLQLPSHVSTNAVIASYLAAGRLYNKPKRGDIVFYSFSTDPNSPFDQPHVGVVTDVEHFTKHGVFQAIEGHTDANNPRGLNVKNGVYKRTRYKYDVLGFGRPYYKSEDQVAPQLSTNGLPVVKSSIMKPGLKHPHITLIQLALARFNNLTGVPQGELDHKTRASYANFQRSIGYVGARADGIPDENSLKVLAARTQIFQVTE